MAEVFSTILDPLGFGFGEAIFGEESAIVNVSDAYTDDDESRDPTRPPDPTPSSPTEGVISDAEAQNLAKKKLYQSGLVYTNALGEDITDQQVAGVTLR